MSTLDDRLLPVLVRQHWLVTNADVLDAGGSLDQVAHRVRTGAWVRVDRSVHRPALAPSTWEAGLLAPILGARPDARILASDLSAAALHGIPGYGRGRPELSTPAGYNLRRPGTRIRISTDLDRCSTVTIDGVPTTDLPRTLLDLGRSAGDARLLRAIEWARRERWVTWGAQRDRQHSSPNCARRGAAT